MKKVTIILFLLFKGLRMTKQEMIKAYQKRLKKIEEDQANFEELGEDFLVVQYNIYIKLLRMLLRMFIKDLEKLD